MNRKNRTASFLAMLMTASALMPSARIWAEERTSLIINDADVGDDINQFHFWVHEGGYPSLFEGGDEHWTTKKQFGDTLPSLLHDVSGG